MLGRVTGNTCLCGSHVQAPQPTRHVALVCPCRNDAARHARAVQPHAGPGDRVEPGSSGDDLNLPSLGANADWRQFRAKLVAASKSESSSRGSSDISAPDSPASRDAGSSASSSSPAESWAHSITQPERGAVLLAHPLYFSTSQAYFYQCVILLLDHSTSGSYGVILNRPTTFKLGEVTKAGMLQEFAECPLNLGGDVGSGGETTVIHPYDLPGAQALMGGLFLGGIEAAQQAVRNGSAQANRFRWFTRYAGWGPGQLEQECKRGVWFIAATSQDLVLTEPSQGDGRDMWHTVLRKMGGDYEQLSINITEAELEAEKAAKSKNADVDGDA